MERGAWLRSSPGVFQKRGRGLFPKLGMEPGWARGGGERR